MANIKNLDLPVDLDFGIGILDFFKEEDACQQ